VDGSVAELDDPYVEERVDDGYVEYVWCEYPVCPE
jgi:hypothetical protein